MQALSEWFTSVVPSLASHPSYILLDAAVKGTVLMLLGVVAAAVLRRSSA